ncbi:hypothetical protein MSIBF_A1470006 [groundwater metagenome]|uniref:Uncharacterized protein n=1 Tax=groundwater metagenome TaxID=717931 RepID=A0A098E918_9ZZZZ
MLFINTNYVLGHYLILSKFKFLNESKANLYAITAKTSLFYSTFFKDLKNSIYRDEKYINKGGVPEIVALNYSESANFFYILWLHMMVNLCVKC